MNLLKLAKIQWVGRRALWTRETKEKPENLVHVHNVNKQTNKEQMKE